MSKYGADDVSIAKWAAGEKAKALSTYQTSAQSTDASVRASAQSTYDKQLSLINSQVAAMSKYGADDVSIAKWAAGEKEAALLKYKNAGVNTAEAVVLANKWAADQQQLAFIKMGKAGDDWAAGVQAQLLEITRAHTTWGSTAAAVTLAFANESKAQLSANFFSFFKGNFNEIGADWEKMLDAMLGTLSNKLADMVVEAAANDIVLLFKSEWKSGGSQVLGIVSKVLGFGDSLINMFSGGSDAGYSTGFGDWTEGLGFAKGGHHPGGWRMVGEEGPELEYTGPSQIYSNAQTNKILQAISSQGRSGDTMLAHINPAEAALLKQLGGSGTINPRTGLPEFYKDPEAWKNPKQYQQDQNTIVSAAQLELAAYRAQMDKIAANLLVAQAAKAKGYSTLFEGDNLVYVSGYSGGEPIGGRTWAPTTALNTSAGSRYYIPSDLLLGGAMENASGQWIYPYLQGGAVGYLQSLSTMNAPSVWPAAAGIPGTWGAIDNPTRGFYVTADQYRNIYSGGYWVPSQDFSWMGVSENGIPVSAYVGGVGGMSLTGNGMYAKNWGGADIWGTLSLNPTNGGMSNTFNEQWGANANNGLGGLLTTIGTGIMTAGGAMLGSLIGMPWLGAGAANALAGVMKGDETEDILKNAALAAAMTYAGGKIADFMKLSQPGTSAGELIDINAGESAAWGYDASTTLADMTAAMQDAGTLPTTFDTIVNKGMTMAAKSVINYALGQAFNGLVPGGGDAGGYMQVSYEGADDGGLLASLAASMKGMTGTRQFGFSARDGLDYVPYDNFIINAHKGEAVITAKENKERNNSRPIHVHFNIDAREIGLAIIKDGDVVEQMDYQLTKFNKRTYG
jgi:hypothetical protein